MLGLKLNHNIYSSHLADACSRYLSQAAIVRNERYLKFIFVRPYHEVMPKTWVKHGLQMVWPTKIRAIALYFRCQQSRQ